MGDPLRVLLSEGSSTNAREIITVLGLAGYTVEVCDPNPWCSARFSRWVAAVHRVPRSGQDPIGYLRAVVSIVRRRGIDVLFPANEQAMLFSWAREELSAITGLAVADYGSFQRIYTKTALTRFLDQLGLPHPDSTIVHGRRELREALQHYGPGCYAKAATGSASIGVWRATQPFEALVDEIEASGALDEPLVVQEQVSGDFEQAHAVFDRGRLVALACDRRLVEGLNGGPALKQGVLRPQVRADVRRMGESLAWHGGFAVDYFWDDARQRAVYIDANPRLTEPMNAYINGVNLPELVLWLSGGEQLSEVAGETRAETTRQLIQVVLGAASRGGRAEIARAFVDAVAHRGVYRGCRESLSPIVHDPRSVLPVAVVLGSVLARPQRAARIAAATIEDYAVGRGVTKLQGHSPREIAITG